MSGQKYYSDGITHYSGNLGTLYYTPTGGSGNINLTPEPVNWMTTTNFSRTERTKSVWVQGTGSYSNLSFEVPISQEESPLMILLSDINHSLTHGEFTEPVSDTINWIWQTTYVLHQADLGETIDIEILVNGNVIDVSSPSVGEKYLISAINTGLWVTNSFDLPQVHLSSAPDEQYEDYPEGLGTTSITTYQVSNIDWGVDTKAVFDTINNTAGTTNSIVIPGGGGSIIQKGLTRWGETNGLVAIKFRVTVNTSIPENTSSTIILKTAVYNSQGVNNVDSNCTDCRGLSISFVLDDSEASLEPEGTGELEFSPAGTMDQGSGETHSPYIEVASNIPWTITDTDPQGREIEQ